MMSLPVLFYVPGFLPELNLAAGTLEFALPLAWLALPLPLLVAWLLPPASAATTALRVPFFQGIQSNPGHSSRSFNWLKRFLALLAWTLLVLAASRPQQIGEAINMPVSGRSLMMAVDISGSMQISDMVIKQRHTSRLRAVKEVAGEFIAKREGDRIGLILFGSQAYLQAPLTFDRKTVQTLLNEAEIGLAGRETAMGDAIGLAVKRLRNEAEKNRVLIVLTDGANTAGNVDPLKAADLAAQEKVRIYAIGVGSEGGYIQTPFGRQRVSGGDLDEATLQAIASKTGGRYFRARDVKGLSAIYALLDEIEPVSRDEISFRPVLELFYYPLSLALLITALLALLALQNSGTGTHIKPGDPA